jgi:HD domain-containing protein
MMAMDVVMLFRTAGANRYGETVTQLEHALQCAALARRHRAGDEVVIAALLHDVGHLVVPAPDRKEVHHGHHGAELLAIRPPAARLAGPVPRRREALPVHGGPAVRGPVIAGVDALARAAGPDAFDARTPRPGDSAMVRRRRSHPALGRRGKGSRCRVPAAERLPPAARAVARPSVVARVRRRLA